MRSKINILGSPVNNCEDSIVSQLKEDKKNVKRLKKDDNRSDNKTNINHVIIGIKVYMDNDELKYIKDLIFFFFT